MKCKHLFAVEYTLERETTPNGETAATETVTKAVKVTYRQNWPAYNAAQSGEKARFMLLLSDLCPVVSRKSFEAKPELLVQNRLTVQSLATRVVACNPWRTLDTPDQMTL